MYVRLCVGAEWSSGAQIFFLFFARGISQYLFADRKKITTTATWGTICATRCTFFRFGRFERLNYFSPCCYKSSQHGVAGCCCCSVHKRIQKKKKKKTRRTLYPFWSSYILSSWIDSKETTLKKKKMGKNFPYPKGRSNQEKKNN